MLSVKKPVTVPWARAEEAKAPTRAALAKMEGIVDGKREDSLWWIEE